MNLKKQTTELDNILSTLDFNDAEKTKEFVFKFLNIIELQHNKIEHLREENQRLKDEINKMKGEKGSPPKKDTSSGKRKSNFKSKIKLKRQGRKNKRKKKDIDIHVEEIVSYEKKLPHGARFKGYRDRVIQGIKVESHNIKYRLERFYSESARKLYEAELPAGCNDGYTPELKSWILAWYYHYRVPEDKILQLLWDMGIVISAGHMSNILIKGKETFHNEKQEILSAGISSTTYQHMDHTGARVMGESQQFSVLCNEFYSAFFIRPRKDRMTVLEILNQGEELNYTITETTIKYLKEKNVPQHIREALGKARWLKNMSKEDFLNSLQMVYQKIKPRYKEIILEAAAVTWYQQQNESEKIKILVTDAAKQFACITQLNALCWIHEDRHYAKLLPLLDKHKELVEEFRDKIWEYYKKLKAYKRNPDEKYKKTLNEEFDELFSTRTGYETLDECIRKTRERKEGLLVALEHPEAPLHNNPAELAVREYIIKRNISMQTRSVEGTLSWETFLSIKDTCRKLGVNFREYLYDRLSGKYELPSLADIIQKVCRLQPADRKNCAPP